MDQNRINGVRELTEQFSLIASLEESSLEDIKRALRNYIKDEKNLLNMLEGIYKLNPIYEPIAELILKDFLE